MNGISAIRCRQGAEQWCTSDCQCTRPLVAPRCGGRASNWPFMTAPAVPAVNAAPRVICAACEKAEAPRPLLLPLCDECTEHLVGYGLSAIGAAMEDANQPRAMG